MEGKNTNKVESISSEKELSLKEVNILESLYHVIKCNKNEINIQSSMSNNNDGIKTEEKEKIIKSNNHILKRKVTEDSATIERVLSEGETSSDFKTISSLDSRDHNIYSSINRDDFSVIVEIKNELAFQDQQKSVGRIICRKGKSNSLCTFKNRSEHFSDNYKSQQNDCFKNFIEQKYGPNDKCIGLNYKNDIKDKNPNEKEEFDYSRWDSSTNQEKSRSRSRSRNLRKRSRWSRKNDQDGRSIHNWSSEHSNRSQSSRNLEMNFRSKSPSQKDRKIEIRSSESFLNNSAKSLPKRKSVPKKKKKKRSLAFSDIVSNYLPPEGVEKKINVSDRIVRQSLSSSCGKKEGTPFLVELERNLKEAENLKNFAEEAVTVPIPEHPSYPIMPMFSVDNLPLVPGPTGLPVHITITGEQILHDMEGRRIPVGPNGHYLPVDPTGRLFPHIISPKNEAVPIHMTEDGVLRLPNSEPIPYGPGHQFPVHVDGSIIFIGPDSKPLYPCFNLPKEPPPLLQTMESSNAENVAAQQVAPVISQIPQQDSGDSNSVSSLKYISESSKVATEEIIISSDDDQDVLRIVYDSKNQETQIKEAKREDPIIKKIHRAIKSLCEKNYKPPALGRFIISNLITDSALKMLPNESPLLRNRMSLPFLTPKAKDVPIKDQPTTAENTAVTFKFLPLKQTFEKEKMHKINNENCGVKKVPVSTIDFSMQCDFTSVIVKSLSLKISDLEKEVVRLKNVNADLLDGYRSVQAMNQKKNDQLRKVALEIEEKDNEIQILKRTLEKRQ